MNIKIHTKLSTAAIAVGVLSSLPASAIAGRYDGIVKGIDDFMGSAASVKRNDNDAFVALGDNGNRFRMDYSGHGDKPHFHFEVPSTNGKHVDAPNTQHRNYFKE